LSETVTVTSKSQITLPKGLRQDLKVMPGDKLVFIKTPEGKYLIDAIKIPKNPTEILEGTLEDLDMDAVSLKHTIYKTVAKRTNEKILTK